MTIARLLDSFIRLDLGTLHTAWEVVCVCGGGGGGGVNSNVFQCVHELEDAYYLCLFASNGSCTY